MGGPADESRTNHVFCKRAGRRITRILTGRGITVCDEWRDDPFSFYRYLDEVLGPCPPGHSIDRVDNDGNYEPGNIRWASQSEQVRNSRRYLK
jgi:hypothetical protein